MNCSKTLFLISRYHHVMLTTAFDVILNTNYFLFHKDGVKQFFSLPRSIYHIKGRVYLKLYGYNLQAIMGTLCKIPIANYIPTES